MLWIIAYNFCIFFAYTNLPLTWLAYQKISLNYNKLHYLPSVLHSLTYLFIAVFIIRISIYFFYFFSSLFTRCINSLPTVSRLRENRRRRRRERGREGHKISGYIVSMSSSFLFPSLFSVRACVINDLPSVWRLRRRKRRMLIRRRRKKLGYHCMVYLSVFNISIPTFSSSFSFFFYLRFFPEKKGRGWEGGEGGGLEEEAGRLRKEEEIVIKNIKFIKAYHLHIYYLFFFHLISFFFLVNMKH